MKILISGVCGFVGSSLAGYLRSAVAGCEIHGLDNFIRPGSEQNRRGLQERGVKIFHADIRCASDFEMLPAVDHVIDAAANPSVLAGLDGRTSSRQLVEHNLAGTVNLLEYCKAHRAGFTLLSTSRVYAIAPLAQLPVRVERDAFVPDISRPLPAGLTINGADESFSTKPPLSLYGSTKLASEMLALEYGEAFGFPVWINRCGVMAGAGQFGQPEQGIFSYWLHAWKKRRPLQYIGFDGAGHQTRDALHPHDLARLVVQQIECSGATERIVNVSGGAAQAMSLRQLSAWCTARWGQHPVETQIEPRPFDIPWLVLDSRRAAELWNWKPEVPLTSILEEIAKHAEAHPDWLEVMRSLNPPDVPSTHAAPLQLLSVVIPARDEEGAVASMVRNLTAELARHAIRHEIIVVDDGSMDRTWPILVELQETMPQLRPIQNAGKHGFGRATIRGLDAAKGDGVIIMMADESDDCHDAVRYWEKLNEGYDCVFGSRFIRGGRTIDYPVVKWILNRLANTFIANIFRINLNDTTNAFKAYRRTVIEGRRPLISPHFNLTIELPLKAIVRGYSWTIVPITWRNRRSGVAKLKIREMGSRYFFICMYVWLEKYFSRGDYQKPAS